MSKAYNFEINVYYDVFFGDTNIQGSDNEVIVTGTITPIAEGRSHGPAELCWADEGGELENIVAYTLRDDGSKFYMSDEWIKEMEDTIYERALEAAQEAYS